MTLPPRKYVSQKKHEYKDVICVDLYNEEVILVGSGRMLRIEKSRINKKDPPKLEIFINDLNSVLNKDKIIEQTQL